MRPGAERFRTLHGGDVLMERVKELLIREDVINPNPEHLMSTRAYTSLVDPLEAAGDYNHVYEEALRDILKVVPTDAINELPDGDQTKKEFWERRNDFIDYIWYTRANG